MSQKPDIKVPPQICILSGVHDDVYRATRSDDPVLCTSAGKRKLLYMAIAEASGAAPLILSPHPRGRGVPSALPETTSEFAGCRQIFARACGIRKIRYFIDYIHYSRHVFHHTNRNSVLIIDNYELIYVLAIYYARFRGRRNPVILEYEDGKHAIDRGWVKGITWLAECLGRPLVKAAILAAPALAERLPEAVPYTLVPGILEAGIHFRQAPRRGEHVHLLYSGSLDTERGIPLLLDYLYSDLICHDVCVEVTGQGKFTSEIQVIANQKPDQIRYHGKVSEEQLHQIRQRCHYGLNLQSSANPISRVTFPSKTFDYLNAGLRLISSKAAGVESVLGAAAIYLDEETPMGLRMAIERAVTEIQAEREPRLESVESIYSLPGTIRRIALLFNEFLIA